MPCEVGLVSDPRFKEHKPAEGHPECPERLEAIEEAVRDSGLAERLVPIEPRPAALEHVLAVHDASYLDWVKEVCSRGGGLLDAGDTGASAESWNVALLAAGSVIQALDYVLAADGRRAFCAVRPPGHHARPARAMGFCILNNVAIGAAYCRRAKGLSSVAILDVDVHHGNGTQEIFYDDPSVLYCSLHQYPHYPGTGRLEESGGEGAEGATVNIPLPAGSGDEEYITAFREVVMPALERHKPEIILLSAGFDCHQSDPLSSIFVTDEGLASLAAAICQQADRYAEGRVVSVLEGGYNLHTLGNNVCNHIDALIDPTRRLPS